MASFNFGNTSTTGLGATSTPTKPAGFGNFSFGATTAAPPAFGAQQPTASGAFGTQQTSATGAFGAAAPAFGTTSGFGGAGAGAPAFGFGTSNSISTSAPSFGFGTQTTSSGAAATPAFGFGTAAPAQNAFGIAAPAQNAFGTGAPAQNAFGTAAPAQNAFGTAAPAQNAFGGLQTNAAPSAFGGGLGSFGTGGFGGFNSTNTTTSAPLFSGFGMSNTQSVGTSGGFGSFGKPTGAPAFGTSFGQPQQQQQQQQMMPPNPDEALVHSIKHVSIFSDERDSLLAAWNLLQTQWGCGKSYYNSNAQPYDVLPSNPLCRFKAMGYSQLPGRDNKIGLVALTFNKTVDQIRSQQQQLIDQLRQVFGNRPNLMVQVETIKPLSDVKCQAVIYVEERQANNNETKRILATEVANYLNQPQPKSQITQMGVEQMIAIVTPDEDQLKEYLDNAPKGVDHRMWEQAIEDNPDATKLIPVAITGFSELKWRVKCQENETDIHCQYLKKAQKDVADLKQRHASTVAKIMEQRRKFDDLSHRILQIIVKQECTRKTGVSLTYEEEELRSKLENMQALVSAPTQFKGRLSELLSQVRMQRNQWNSTINNEYALDKDSSEEMISFLSMQQNAMAFLIDTVNKDTKALKIISEGMKHMVRE